MEPSKVFENRSFVERVRGRAADVFFSLLLLLCMLIPFQPRIYKFLQPFSLSLINPGWHLPPYFEVHLDIFISDFVILLLVFYGLKKSLMQWKSFWEGENKFLSLFLLISLASIIHSPFATYPLPYWRWMHLVLPAGLFFLLSRYRIEEGSFSKIAQAVLAASLLECAIAIPQYFLQHSLGLKVLGEPTLMGRHYLGSHFPMSDGSVWIFDRLFYGVRQHFFVIRAYGTLPHPNILGGFMVLGLIMTYYLWGQGKKRGLLSGAIALQVFCLFITYSRSALYAAGFVTVVWVLLTSLKEKKISALVWVAGGSFLLSLGLLYPQLFERGGVVSYNAVAQSSDALRLTVQDVGIAMLRAHPLLGIGFNNYMLAFPTFAQGPSLPATYIHNLYLHLGVEVGILGVLSFLIFCFLVLKKGWEHRQSAEVLTCLCVFVAFLCIGLVDFYPLCAQQARLIFFLSAGLVMSMTRYFGSRQSR
ncbi:MAG: O-antigen ligase family protein [Verrucomicrobia bacterium]|nr:O-antigen ligase family protein [Verrucomicrobiota bacterium]